MEVIVGKNTKTAIDFKIQMSDTTSHLELSVYKEIALCFWYYELDKVFVRIGGKNKYGNSNKRTNYTQCFR